MENMFCNPLNLEYRYQIKDALTGKGVFREAADPTMILFKGKYLLFCSMSGGFWYSDDLYDWKFHETPELPICHYAPDVREVNGQILFCASHRGEACKIYRSPDPLRVPFQAVSAPFAFWDPNIFQDDDGRVYLYWGCSSKEPLYGIELDSKTLVPTGEKKVMFGENVARHGWERKGENNVIPPPKKFRDYMMRLIVGTKPFIEGAYVNKVNGKYYLQYAAPGTEVNVYSDGVYVSDSPLGPWEYQKHNPFSSVPGGFMTGAGHGSTFRDKVGKWWHVSTMRISVNENFERRIGLFPCDFDGDGIMYCNQNFACYPQALDHDMKRIALQMNLLSYSAAATASSFQPGFEPKLGVDENCRTWWAAEENDKKAWYRIDLGEVKTVQAIQVNFADHKIPMLPMDRKTSYKDTVGYRVIKVQPQKTAYLLEGSADGENWVTLKDNRNENTDFTHDLTVLSQVGHYRYLRLSHMEVAMGGVPAVSGLRVFGKGNGSVPASVERLIYKRSQDGLNLKLQWTAAEGAEGYNVRYGISPDKLYNSWQVIGKTELDLSMINADTQYWVAIDSYNENGMTESRVFSTAEV